MGEASGLIAASEFSGDLERGSGARWLSQRLRSGINIIAKSDEDSSSFGRFDVDSGPLKSLRKAYRLCGP